MKQQRLVVMLCLLTMALCLFPGAWSAQAESITVDIQVRLSITGTKPPDASVFSFALRPDQADHPMPASNAAKISGEGTAAFGSVEYTIPNDYTYTLYQVAGNTAGYTYDARVYHVTVQVTSDENGKLAATVTLRDGAGNKPGLAVFENRYALNTDIPKTGDEKQEPRWRIVTGCLLLAAGVALTLYRRTNTALLPTKR